MSSDALLARVHHAFIAPLQRLGRPPAYDEVRRELDLSEVELDTALHDLADRHGVVLHPHRAEPWILHPFSLSPTATWVEHGSRGWWAPCIWCACGVVALAGGNGTIHARLGGEREAVSVEVRDGQVRQSDLLVHFAVPPREAWNNVHHFCATVLPFESDEAVVTWSQRHALPLGEVVPFPTVMALGSRWYGRHCDPDWRKWTASEAAAIFRDVGLTSSFWQLDEQADRF
jgi:hypothetical protein